jgi:hypothetical protein
MMAAGEKVRNFKRKIVDKTEEGVFPEGACNVRELKWH